MTAERKEYELTEAQLKRLLEASKPTRYLIVGGRGPRSPQEAALSVWEDLAEEMEFNVMTVKPVPGKGERVFSAVPSAKEE